MNEFASRPYKSRSHRLDLESEPAASAIRRLRRATGINPETGPVASAFLRLRRATVHRPANLAKDKTVTRVRDAQVHLRAGSDTVNHKRMDQDLL